MKFIDSKNIDSKKWDLLVENSPINNVFCYSWYLKATSENWGVVVNDDFTVGIPFAFKKWLFYKKIFQHPFSRNLDFFGDKKYIELLPNVLREFNRYSFCLLWKIGLNLKEKKYQNIQLKDEISYHKNAVRILTKNKTKYSFKFSKNYQTVLDFYFENSFHKIKQQKKNKVFLKHLLIAAIENNKGEVLEVYDENSILTGASFFLKDKETICYLIGDCNEKHKKDGLMFSSMDFAINHYKNEFSIFDFGGSNIESVATFYKKMGGKDVIYYEYYKK